MILHDNDNYDHEEASDRKVLVAHGPSVNPPRAGQRAGERKCGSHSPMHRRDEDRESERAAGAARAPALIV